MTPWQADGVLFADELALLQPTPGLPAPVQASLNQRQRKLLCSTVATTPAFSDMRIEIEHEVLVDQLVGSHRQGG